MDSLYRYTFTLEGGSTFTCNAADQLEAIKHLERATGFIKFITFEVTQVMRAPL